MPADDIGILAIEVYFPRFYVRQADLEVSDECVGKYTKGFGQEAVGVCCVEEDVTSMSLTVISQLINRIDLDLKTVGFLEVGSETLIDKSKSTKSVLMQLFEESGNFDVEGVDVKNACFGGTAALFHAINWLESSSWDGRLALVVAADVAVYGTKSARPTGGAGAVAILLGPNAPLVIDRGLRAHHVQHQYDFYKPDLSSEYPLLDGPLSMQCYKEALLRCYETYKQKAAKQGFTNVTVAAKQARVTKESSHSLPVDFLCFHCPFTRLVRKAFGWLALEDVRFSTRVNQGSNEDKPDCQTKNSFIDSKGVTHVDGCTTGEGDVDPMVKQCLKVLTGEEPARELDAICMQATAEMFAVKVEPSLAIAKQVGNMYTASLYSCLASLLLSVPTTDLRGRRILLYSYGSGFVSAMFSLRVHPSRPLDSVVHALPTMGAHENPVFQRLYHERSPLTVAQFEELLDERKAFHNAVSFKPTHRPHGLFPGSYYLNQVDECYRRSYSRVPSHLP